MIDAHDLLPSPEQSRELLALLVQYVPNRPTVLADFNDLQGWGLNRSERLEDAINALQRLKSMGREPGECLAEVEAALTILLSLRNRTILAQAPN